MNTSKFFILGLLTITSLSLQAMRMRVIQRVAQKLVLAGTGITGGGSTINSWAPTQAPGATSLNSGTYSAPPANALTTAMAGASAQMPAMVQVMPGTSNAALVSVGGTPSAVPAGIWNAISAGFCQAMNTPIPSGQLATILTGASTYPDRHQNPNTYRNGPMGQGWPTESDRLFNGIDGGLAGEMGPLRRGNNFGQSESSNSSCIIL